MDLASDLRTPKNNLKEFHDTAFRALSYMPEVITNSNFRNNFVIHESTNAGSTKFLRPVNTALFIESPSLFKEKYATCISYFETIKESRGERTFGSEALSDIDSVIYTIHQSIGCGMDLLINSNSARKHLGNRLEELMRCVFNAIGVTNKRIVLKIPYEHEGKTRTYKCENDLILSPYKKVKSSSTNIDEKEIVVSAKTSSKDRMGKIFIDKILLQEFVGHDLKVIGIFLNDVQRKKTDNISYTLVSGLFMVYTKFLTPLEGVYYLDSPPQAKKEPYDRYMHKFSDLVTKQVWEMLTS
ncbi:MAG: hypothetical protein WD059_07465 [Balneolaceae bacterium]